jgi:hypothetical protein
MKKLAGRGAPDGTPPDGLERARPREVRLTSGGRALTMVAGAFFAGAVLAFALLTRQAAQDAADRADLREHGVNASATVTRLWRARSENRQTWVAYRFDAGGRSYEGRTRIGAAEWGRLAVGASVPVRYLPDDPRRRSVGGREPRVLNPAVPVLAALGLALFGAVMLLPLRGERRLLAEGRAARARIVAEKKTGKETVVEYEFAVLSGAHVRGHKKQGMHPRPIGSSAWVLYDPDDPKRSALYPFALVTPVHTRRL